MPVAKTIMLYRFDELPTEKAKEKARSWLRELVFSDSNDTEHIYEDAIQVGKIIGIEIKQKSEETYGGKMRDFPCIYYSGFSSQGDGAQFEGNYSYAKGCHKKVRSYAPTDKELHRIADSLRDIQKRYKYKLVAMMDCNRAQYSHSGWMNVAVSKVNDQDGTPGEVIDNKDEERITRLMRDFADWIYKQLQNEYDYQTKDEALEEGIRANEYTFTAAGKREDL